MREDNSQNTKVIYMHRWELLLGDSAKIILNWWFVRANFWFKIVVP